MARVANVLKAHGVRKGDRVCIYLPMIPELAYTMLACARIGAVHSVVFAGFSAESLRDRILDAGCKVVFTANEGLRGGKTIPLKATVDQAVDGLDLVEKVLVVRRTETTRCRCGRGATSGSRRRRRRQRSTCPVEWMAAEDPLFILYTSGSTGKPKGVLHTTGGYLVYAAITHKYVFDYHPGDIYCCAADIGWVTGHSYILYGPLANGATTVMFESIPTYPDAGRYWRMVDDLGVNIFYTAPTAHPRHRPRRRRVGDSGTSATRCASWARSASRSTRRSGAGTTTWWASGRCAVVDTWWQTETGGILITPLPGATPTKPGSATLPFFGIQPVLVDERGQGARGQRRLGQPLPARHLAGAGAHHLRRPPALPRDLLLAVSRPLLHRRRLPARRGRLLLDHRPRRRRAERLRPPAGHGGDRERAGGARGGGRGGGGRLPARHQGHGHLRLRALRQPDSESWDREELIGALKEQVRHAIGAIATPDRIQVVAGLPKTRSGKIMRRILRKIAAGEYDELGDITTLADPAVVEKLVDDHRAAG